jgi:hypothetical protein
VGLAHMLVREAVCPKADCSLILAADNDPEYADPRDDNVSSYAGLGVPTIAAEALAY